MLVVHMSIVVRTASSGSSTSFCDLQRPHGANPHEKAQMRQSSPVFDQEYSLRSKATEAPSLTDVICIFGSAESYSATALLQTLLPAVGCSITVIKQSVYDIRRPRACFVNLATVASRP